MRFYVVLGLLPLLGGAAQTSDGFGETNDGINQAQRLLVQDGILLQVEGCPQEISQEEALVRAQDSSLPGGVLALDSLDQIGRAGNHFRALSTMLSVAFCCQSKVLLLPDSDNQFPTVGGDRFRPGASQFSFFSNVTDPDDTTVSFLRTFGDLRGRAEVCPDTKTVSGAEAYFFLGFHPDLDQCVNSVVLRGCEAVYVRDVVNSCPRRHQERRLGDDISSISSSSDRSKEDVDTTATSAANDQPAATSDVEQSLVIFIRSGDIFNPVLAREHPGLHIYEYGQPPLAYYLHLLEVSSWSNATIVTHASSPEEVSPTFRILEELGDTGFLGPNFQAYKYRSLWMDLRAMLCADALVVGKSTLSFFLLAHSRAKRFFLPTDCGAGKPRTRFQKDHLDWALLCMERPDAEVYGIHWKTSKEAYTPEREWNVSETQRLEMILTDEVVGVVRCCV